MSQQVNIWPCYLYCLVDVFLVTGDLVRREKPIGITSNTVTDSVALTKKSSAPQNLGAVFHCIQVLGVTEHLPQTISLWSQLTLHTAQIIYPENVTQLFQQPFSRFIWTGHRGLWTLDVSKEIFLRLLACPEQIPFLMANQQHQKTEGKTPKN